MAKKNNNKKAREAAAKAQQAQKQETKVYLTPNDMINEAVHNDFVGFLKAKRKNGLLDVNITKQDARSAIMKRNEQQSPLLRLPAELHNEIFRLVVGDQHIHISGSALMSKPTTPHPPDSGYDILNRYISAMYSSTLYPRTRDGGRYLAPQRASPHTFNTTFPLEWRDYYDTIPLTFNETVGTLSMMLPEKRVVYDSGSKMTIFAATCRQIHQEIGLLMYSANEFSFSTPGMLDAWLAARALPQAQAVKTIWVDFEWSSYPPLKADVSRLAAPQVEFKVSRLAWKAVSKAFWEKNTDLDEVAICDFDRDMDFLLEFGTWIQRSCGKLIDSGRIEIEYVKE